MCIYINRCLVAVDKKDHVQLIQREREHVVMFAYGTDVKLTSIAYHDMQAWQQGYAFNRTAQQLALHA